MSISKILREIDVFRRIPRDLTEASLQGSLMTILSVIFMLSLIFIEIWTFITKETETGIILDPNVDSQLRINFNITMHEIPCEFATLDIVDVIGTKVVDFNKNVDKWSIGDSGSRLAFHGRNKEQADLEHEENLPSIDDLHRNGEHATPATKDTFKDLITANDYVFVDYYAPWCIWCQRLAPVWETLAEEIDKSQLPLIIVKVDCVDNDVLCLEGRIQAYPTLRMFKKGVAVTPDYKNDRTVAALTEYAKSQIDPDALVKGRPMRRRPEPIKPVPAEPEGDKEVQPEELHTGCMLSGNLLVNRVPGDFHLVPRSKHHNFHPAAMNLSHTVNHLSFGSGTTNFSPSLLKRLKSVPEAFDHTNVMDGVNYVTLDTHHVFHHHIKVVGHFYETEKRYKGRNDILAYKMIQQSQQIKYNEEDVPEALFSYDISPMSVVVTVKTKEWYAFLTSLCAILGGTFTVVSIGNSLLFGLFKPKKL